jgi:hypothetical protein
VHALLFVGITNDDAAITYAFADQAASGQPVGTWLTGAPVVEGYSNPTWMALLSVARRLGISPPTAAPILGLTLLVGVVVVTGLLAELLDPQGPPVAIFLVAASTTITLWAVTGLENALVGLLVALAAYLFVRQHQDGWTGWRTLPSAVVLALVAISRPDGLVFLAVGAAGLVATPVLAKVKRRPIVRGTVWSVVAWLATAGALVGGYLLWHVHHFGVLQPNTVYAKATPTLSAHLSALFDMNGLLWQGLTYSFIIHGALFLLPLALIGAWSARRTGGSWLVAFWLAALVLPLWEPDWMTDARFYSTFAILSMPLVQIGAHRVLDGSGGLRQPSRRILVAASLVVFVAVSVQATHALGGGGGLVTTDGIAARYSATYDDIDRLGLIDPQVVLPDVGDPVFNHGVRVLDSAGLLDAEVAHSNGSPLRMRSYVFDEQRPELFDTHGVFSERWGLDLQVLRAAGYLPLRIRQQNPLDADLVRRDVVIRPMTPGGGDRVDASFPGVAEPGGQVPVEVLVAPGSNRTGDAVVTTRLLDQQGHEVSRQNAVAGFGAATMADLSPGEALRARLVLPVPPDTDGNLTVETQASADGAEVGSQRGLVRIGDDPLVAAAANGPGGAPDDVLRRWHDLALANPRHDEAIAEAEHDQCAQGRANASQQLEAALAAGRLDLVQAAAGDMAQWRGREDASDSERTLAEQLAEEADGTSDAESRIRLLQAGTTVDPGRPQLVVELADLERTG